MMKKLGDSSYLKDLQLIRKYGNEYNRTYRDAMEEEKEHENLYNKSHVENVKSSPFPRFN